MARHFLGFINLITGSLRPFSGVAAIKYTNLGFPPHCTIKGWSAYRSISWKRTTLRGLLSPLRFFLVASRSMVGGTFSSMSAASSSTRSSLLLPPPVVTGCSDTSVPRRLVDSRIMLEMSALGVLPEGLRGVDVWEGRAVVDQVLAVTGRLDHEPEHSKTPRTWRREGNFLGFVDRHSCPSVVAIKHAESYHPPRCTIKGRGGWRTCPSRRA